jgi:hypothetical protein
MQMELSGAGAGKPKGGGQEMQLPDIITKQQGLVDKIKRLDKGKSPGGEKNVGNSGRSSGDAGEGDANIMDIYKSKSAA